MRRLIPLTILAAGLSACGDPTSPGLRPGLHRFTLHSVNGQRVPYVLPPSMGYTLAVDGGELLLKPNGTFSHGIDGSGGGIATGTYAIDGATVLLRLEYADGGTFTQPATLAGDSLIVTIAGGATSGDVPGPVATTQRYVYLRTAPPADRPARLFVLTEANGRPAPFILYDATSSAGRMVSRVEYDTLRLIDGLFYRRARAARDVTYLASGDSVYSAYEYNVGGTYAEGAGRVILNSYGGGYGAMDTLSVDGTALVRTTSWTTISFTERYTPR